MFSTPSRHRAALTPRLLLLALALAACGDAAPSPRAVSAAPADSAVSLVDDAGRAVTLPRPAGRVVSLIPSATETLFALGAGAQVVGRTDFDKGPAVAHLPSVGGGLDPSLESLVALRPDVVIGWAEEKSPKIRERLAELGIPLFTIQTTDTTDLFRTVGNLGRLTGHTRAADSLSASLRGELNAVRASVAGLPRPSVFYIVWYDPPMTAGPRTFVSQIVEVAGGRTVFPDVQGDWPTISVEELVRRQPDVVVLPVGEMKGRLEELRGMPGWSELRALREGRVAQLPADLLNRPGPHLGEAARALRDALHPARAGR